MCFDFWFDDGIRPYTDAFYLGKYRVKCFRGTRQRNQVVELSIIAMRMFGPIPNQCIITANTGAMTSIGVNGALTIWMIIVFYCTFFPEFTLLLRLITNVYLYSTMV